MQILDFARSFILFRVDTIRKPPVTVTHKPPFTVNNARVPIECHCRILHRETGITHSFNLGASCKTERVNVDRDIWTQPNADFMPLVSDTQFLSVKTFDHAGRRIRLYPPELGDQPIRQIVDIESSFDDLRITLTRMDAEPLDSADEVVEAVLANQVLVATTEITTDRYQAHLEYPVKTINVSEREHFYQTDTGPVLFPDFTAAPADLLATMQTAFTAFNQPDWIEFLVRDITPVNADVSVFHYSRPVRVNAVNRLWRQAAG